MHAAFDNCGSWLRCLNLLHNAEYVVITAATPVVCELGRRCKLKCVGGHASQTSLPGSCTQKCHVGVFLEIGPRAFRSSSVVINFDSNRFPLVSHQDRRLLRLVLGGLFYSHGGISISHCLHPIIFVVAPHQRPRLFSCLLILGLDSFEEVSRRKSFSFFILGWSFCGSLARRFDRGWLCIHLALDCDQLPLDKAYFCGFFL